MYQCSLQIAVFSHHQVIGEVIREIPPLEHFHTVSWKGRILTRCCFRRVRWWSGTWDRRFFPPNFACAAKRRLS